MLSNHSHSNALDSSKFLSHEEDRSLKFMLEKDSSRNALILMLLRQYGMRCGELLDLRKKDVFIDSRSIFIRGTKGSLDREFPLGHQMFLRVMDQVEKCADEEAHVFPISIRRLQAIWHFYRPCEKGLHSLRHTCAIRLYEAHKDIKIVQRVLGHKFLTSTLVYQEFFYSQEEFRRVLVG